MADGDFHPKQPLTEAIARGISRPQDSPERQRVRMGDDPLRMLRDDAGARAARAAGAKKLNVPTVGDIAGKLDEERAASRPVHRRSRRGGSR